MGLGVTRFGRFDVYDSASDVLDTGTVESNRGDCGTVAKSAWLWETRRVYQDSLLPLLLLPPLENAVRATSKYPLCVTGLTRCAVTYYWRVDIGQHALRLCVHAQRDSPLPPR